MEATVVVDHWENLLPSLTQPERSSPIVPVENLEGGA